MTELERQIEELTHQLQELRSKQMQMSRQLVLAEGKLQKLQAMLGQTQPDIGLTQSAVSEAKEFPQSTDSEEIATPANMPHVMQAKRNIQEKKILQQRKTFYVNREMEDFIGTNVISKIGIIVTIIGVFVGAKYAIDNELISPLTRILAGYLSAGVLIFIAFRLKAKYEYFSSVLIGGGLAVTYFITYIAFSFYALFPMFIAFAIMMITTAAAVAIALWYNQKVIALLGQVAAYAIPFLLGDGTGNVFVLFGYVSLINFGLLLLSFKKDWKLLYHIAFFLTWLIYLFLVVGAEKVAAHFTGGVIFLAINFFTFYITFLAYKIFKKELYRVGEIGILLLNALFFFFIGVYFINHEFANVHFLTWFTIANACVHFAAGYFIYKLRLVDNSVFQFILGLGLLFITIAIPIELDGNWVTILWTIEATALYYVARNTNRLLYLEIALPLVIISFLSLFHDWASNYSFIKGETGSPGSVLRTPFININFTLSLFVCACLGFMSFLNAKVTSSAKSFTVEFFAKILPVAFLGILYFAFFNEIHFAWDKNISLHNNSISLLYQSVTLIIFSCVYVAAWLIINSGLIKSEKLHHLLLLSALLANAVFLFNGLIIIGELRENYIVKAGNATKTLLIIRYLAFVALATLWISIYNASKIFKQSDFARRITSTAFNVTLLSVISNEFIHWMDLSGYQNQYKLGLSLICGGYALALLFTGMVKKKKHLRISAIILFAATLLKLFFYDLESLSTISKTIVLVLLGILLLLASFLYNKYKDLLFTNEEAEK
ncbi:MAG: hypothetical protein JWR18_1497 [Segetibacter sp.]|nr:hypothetical protein [Segetibacter sp.]